MTEKPSSVNDSTDFSPFASAQDLDPEVFPEIGTISAAFMFKFLPKPRLATPPEFVYLDADSEDIKGNKRVSGLLAIAQWNVAWETAQLRYAVFYKRLPASLRWLKKYRDTNLYLLPRPRKYTYETYALLHHLLPEATLKQFGLPHFARGIWPPLFVAMGHRNSPVPATYGARLSEAFASHVWPHICSGSSLRSFRKNEPVRLLAHSLDFWLPYAVQLAESRKRDHGPVDFEHESEKCEMKEIRKLLPADVDVTKPYFGGSIWTGEEQAREATSELVERADACGKLRAIMDAVRSNRIEDDFSEVWSRAKEDFERKLYHKRNKLKVSFVQLDDTIPVHGPDAEVHESLLWQDFMGLLDVKERRVIVLLRNGHTKIGEIAHELGYANHSPVSKALSRIRRKARQYFDLK